MLEHLERQTKRTANQGQMFVAVMVGDSLTAAPAIARRR